MASMLSLPRELLTMIAAEVEDKDYPNLRLACKELCLLSTEHFGRTLVHRRFIFSLYSLQDLIDLTAHPVYSHYIRSLEFSAHRLTRDDKPKKGKRYPKCWRPLENFMKAGKHIRMLSRALTNLKGHGNDKVRLGLFEDKLWIECELKKTYGSEETFTNFARHMCWRVDAASTLSSILSAAEVSGYGINGLTLDARKEFLCLAHQQPELDQLLGKTLLSDSGHLKPGIQFEWRLHCIKSHTATHKIEISAGEPAKLSFSTHDGAGNQVCACDALFHLGLYHLGLIGAAVRSAPLHELTLEDCTIGMDQLKDVLSTHKNTLRRLTLDHVVFTVPPLQNLPDQYKRFNEEIEEVGRIGILAFVNLELQLDYLFLNQVFTINENLRIGNPGLMVCRSRDTVHLKLSILVSKLISRACSGGERDS